MARISKNENGKTVIVMKDETELQAIREEGTFPLEDDEMDSVSGGIKFEIIEPGYDVSYHTCRICDSIDFDVIDFSNKNIVKAKCRNCGTEQYLTLDTYDDM